MNRPLFRYKLLPSRPTFPADITKAEMAVMRTHSAYWRDLLGSGHAVVFSQVSEPTGAWGLAVVEGESAEQVETFSVDDPAVVNGLRSVGAHPMPVATARPWLDTTLARWAVVVVTARAPDDPPLVGTTVQLNLTTAPTRRQRLPRHCCVFGHPRRPAADASSARPSSRE